MAQENVNNNASNNNGGNSKPHYNNKRYGYGKPRYHKNGPQGTGNKKQEKSESIDKTECNDKIETVEKKERPERPQNHFRNNKREKIRDVKLEETVEDIHHDMKRIEKEIELEIREIAALKLGL